MILLGRRSTCLRSRIMHLPPSRPNRIYMSVQLSQHSAKCSKFSSSSPLNVSQRACTFAVRLLCYISQKRVQAAVAEAMLLACEVATTPAYLHALTSEQHKQHHDDTKKLDTNKLERHRLLQTPTEFLRMHLPSIVLNE